MEHSLLHGVQLCALIFGTGTAFFRVLLFHPVLKSGGVGAQNGSEFKVLLNRFGTRVSLAGAVAAALDILVQTAELQNRTVWGAVNLSVLRIYLGGTTAGQLALVQTILFIVLAIFSRSRQLMASWGAVLAGIFAILATSFVSHAAALPDARTPMLAAQFGHILFASLWLGMLSGIYLLSQQAVRSGSSDATGFLSGVVQRFSPFALVSSILLALSGVYAATILIGSPRAVLISPYGLTLVTKLGLLVLVLFAAFRNWLKFRPALARGGPDLNPILSRFTKMLELELTAGILVIAAAGVLGAIAPPGPDQSAQLNSTQLTLLGKPALPPLSLIDPAEFVGAANRNEADLRYAEFTHRWSGLFVILLGLCWLGQMTAAKSSNLLSRLWPLLLIPFAAFVTLAADPEVWMLRSMTLSTALQNPQLLEHQIGGALLFLMVWLGLRDSRRASAERPLGPSLPLLMIAGGLMLLGHAHASAGVPDSLATLINVQHAVMGSLALFAGSLRWFQHRRIFTGRLLSFAWPGCVILLGIALAFFYREMI